MEGNSCKVYDCPSTARLRFRVSAGEILHEVEKPIKQGVDRQWSDLVVSFSELCS